MMNYEYLKVLAKSLKRPAPSLIALSPQNDPFYCGMPAQVEKAKWFRDLWEEYGYTNGLHLRRMHYQIISQRPPVQMVNGKPYENTEQCWDELGKASQAARYLDMVDPENFVDRRNGAPVDNIDYETAYTSSLDLRGAYRFDPFMLAQSMKLPDFPALPDYLFTVSSPQRYHLEMWCEKSTQDDILRPLAQEYGAALQYGLGELSVTLAVEAMRRFEKSGKPVRIFYISDFDPAGRSMPLSMSRKLEYYNLKFGWDLDIKLFPVVLTSEQVRDYDLPRTPIKDGEKRRSKFEERFGLGATELDALEALHQGALEAILRQELDRYYDADLEDAITDYESEMDRQLEEIVERIHDEHSNEMSKLDNEWQAIQDEFKQRLDSQIEKRRGIWQAICERLEEEKPDNPQGEIPEAEYAEERDGALYDSSREYFEQNDVYLEWKGKDAYEEEEIA